MSELVNSNLFLVKEHVGLFKAANNYDIYDPASGEMIMQCREPSLGSCASHITSSCAMASQDQRNTGHIMCCISLEPQKALR